MKKIQFMDTSFRDGIQSFFGARVLPSDLLPAIEAAADAGIEHMETAGGAHFQSMSLYCNASAFDAMDATRRMSNKIKLQSLARGINVVALTAQPRDMIKLHAQLFKKHGVDIIRNFDALNDMRNLQYSAQVIKEAGLHHQATITMMTLPPHCSGAHDVAFYMKTVRDLLQREIPYDSIAFKDSTGTTSPQIIYQLVKEVRKLLGDKVLLWMHTHATAGIGELQYKAAIEAGIDGIDLARRPLSGGTSQPDLLSMWHALQGSAYTLDIDYKKILQANRLFEESMHEYFFPPEAMHVSPEVIFSPMPGGALTANTMMMRDTHTLHLYDQVIEEMGEVISKGGFATSVTPVSQFYFQQAYANVTLGRWKKITEGFGKVVLGYFGKTPVAPDAELVRLAGEQLHLPQTEDDPLDRLSPFTPQAKEILHKNNLPVSDENIFLISALNSPSGNKGLDYLLGKLTINVRKEVNKSTPPSEVKSIGTMQVSCAGKSYTVEVDDRGDFSAVLIEGKRVEVHFANTPTRPVEVPASRASAPSSISSSSWAVKAKLPGAIVKIVVKVGDLVKEGDPLLILEAMKMENVITSSRAGEVFSVDVRVGDVVKEGDLLCTIKR